MLLNETREPPAKLKPTQIRCRKLYELVVQRNEWTDWHGSTDIVHRSSNFAATREADTFDVMSKRAESQRKQGSRFLLRVIPVLVIENTQHCLMVGERRTDKPLFGLMKHPEFRNFGKLSWTTIFAELFAFSLLQRDGCILIPKDRASVANLEKFDSQTPCFHFESRPHPKAASLGWAACGRVATDEFLGFVAAVRKKKAVDAKQLV